MEEESEGDGGGGRGREGGGRKGGMDYDEGTLLDA